MNNKNTFQQYLTKTRKAHYYTYRPREYYKNNVNYNIKVILCSIANGAHLHFSFGADILDKKIHEMENVLGDRGVLYDSITYKKFGINKSVYENIPVRDFDLILISAYMCFQSMNIIPFFYQCKIPMLKYKRKQVVILGGNCALHYKWLKDFVDVFYFGDGEVHIKDIINLRIKNKNKEDYISALIDNIGYCITTGEEKEIIPAIQKDIGNSILGGNDFISKPTNKVLEIQRGCRYNCHFCFLQAYKYPYRINQIDDITKALSTYGKDRSIYPFAPDEASYPYKKELIQVVHDIGCKLYSYNKRFDTFDENIDFNMLESTSRIVLGLDGLSERMRLFCNKQIVNDNIYNVLESICEFKKCTLLKLNSVVCFPYEDDKDYDEFIDMVSRICEYRMKYRLDGMNGKDISDKLDKGESFKQSGALMINFAFTPFSPTPGTVFEFLPSCFTEIKRNKIVKILHKLKRKYMFIKHEGFNGVSSHNVEVFLWRAGEEFIPIFKKWYDIMGASEFLKYDVFEKFIDHEIGMSKYLGYIDNSIHPEIKFRYTEKKRKELCNEAVKLVCN